MDRIAANTRIIALIFAAVASTASVSAQDAIYTTWDSIFIEAVIAKHPGTEYNTSGERAVAIAKEFIGQKYAGGTLERMPEEPLVVSTSELDCTTFMELVVAMTVCKDNEADFCTVCRNIEKIRYRNGIRMGYESRLHYISWWIDDSAKQDIVEEIHSVMHRAEQDLKLDYMSMNSEKYQQLKENRKLIDRIKEHERPYQKKRISYIPKESLKSKETKDVIKEGDIIAIVTNIEGLDVTHIGIAHWINGKLHMIHASSSRRQVICDESSLYDYLSRNSRHLGIRVFRLI